MMKKCGTCKFYQAMRPVDLTKPAGTLGVCQFHFYHKAPHALRQTLLVNEYEDGQYCPTYEPIALQTAELNTKADALQVEITRVELRLTQLRAQLDAARPRQPERKSA